MGLPTTTTVHEKVLGASSSGANVNSAKDATSDLGQSFPREKCFGHPCHCRPSYALVPSTHISHHGPPPKLDLINFTYWIFELSMISAAPLGNFGGSMKKIITLMIQET